MWCDWHTINLICKALVRYLNLVRSHTEFVKVPRGDSTVISAGEIWKQQDLQSTYVAVKSSGDSFRQMKAGRTGLSFRLCMHVNFVIWFSNIMNCNFDYFVLL